MDPVNASEVSKLFGRNVPASSSATTPLPNQTCHSENASGIDYTASRFHSSLASRPDQTLQVYSAIRAGLEQEKAAMEKAREEVERSQLKRARTQGATEVNLDRAVERGNAAQQLIDLNKQKR